MYVFCISEYNTNRMCQAHTVSGAQNYGKSRHRTHGVGRIFDYTRIFNTEGAKFQRSRQGNAVEKTRLRPRKTHPILGEAKKRRFRLHPVFREARNVRRKPHFAFREARNGVSSFNLFFGKQETRRESSNLFYGKPETAFLVPFHFPRDKKRRFLPQSRFP